MLFHFPFFYKCSAIHESLNDHFSLPRIFLRISISTRQRDSSTLILFKRSTSSTTKKKKNQTPSLSLRLFPRINFETFRSHIQLSSSYKTARIHILAKEKKIKFILHLFLPKFHRFPPDYFYESISRDNPIPYPLFRVLWTHTHTRFHRSNGTRSFDLHKAWAYPFQGVFRGKIPFERCAGSWLTMRRECVYRCTCPSRFDVTLTCNFRPRVQPPPATVFALTYKRAHALWASLSESRFRPRLHQFRHISSFLPSFLSILSFYFVCH